MRLDGLPYNHKKVHRVYCDMKLNMPRRTKKRLVTGGADHFLPHLSEAFTWATQTDLAVAFIKTTGLRLLLPDLEAMVETGAP